MSPMGSGQANFEAIEGIFVVGQRISSRSVGNQKVQNGVLGVGYICQWCKFHVASRVNCFSDHLCFLQYSPKNLEIWDETAYRKKNVDGDYR